jgi:hypothetical protein
MKPNTCAGRDAALSSSWIRRRFQHSLNTRTKEADLMRGFSLTLSKALDPQFCRALAAEIEASGSPACQLVALYAVGIDRIAIHGMGFVHDDHLYTSDLRRQLDQELAASPLQRESLALLIDLQAASCCVTTLASALAEVQKRS